MGAAFSQAESSNYQVQMIEGIETLKVTGAERRAMEHWSNLFVKVMNVSIARGKLAAIVDSCLNALATASPLVLLGYGGHLVLQGELSLGTMLAMNALAVGFLGPLSSLVATALQLQSLRSYIERVDDIVAHVAGNALSGDVLLVMSNGSFGGIHGKLLETLRRRAARPAMPDRAG